MNSRAFEIIQPVGLVLLQIPEFQFPTNCCNFQNVESVINVAVAILNRVSSTTVLHPQVQAVRV